MRRAARSPFHRLRAARRVVRVAGHAVDVAPGLVWALVFVSMVAGCVTAPQAQCTVTARATAGPLVTVTRTQVLACADTAAWRAAMRRQGWQ